MKYKVINKILLFLFILFLTETNSYSQAESSSSLKNAVVIDRLTLPVTFDGIPDEEAWNSVTPLKMIMHTPVFGKDPTEKTITRIGYDDQYLYITAQLLYQNPGMMQSVSLKRDFMGMGGDWFGFVLDTFNDKENGLAFFTSPHGLRFDATIQKDAVLALPDQIPINLSWSTFWDVRTKINENGWSVEIRIPFSSLRFQEINGEVRMGLIVQRWIPKKNETDIFPAIPPNWGQFSAMKPSQAQEVVLRGIKPDNPVYIAPYFLSGFESKYDLNNPGTDYKRSGKPILEAGLDFKYGLSNSMIMDVTVNTDFAQVEADEQQVNLTRFSLYFPEKRMFFLERASVFDFALGGNSNLFYSRRIGLSEDGDPVRIYGGGRMTGRVGKWDLGILDMQTAPLWKMDSIGKTEKILPSENFGVIRFRRQILNDNTYVGGILTSRLGVDGTYNLAYGIDGIIRLFGEDYLELKWSQTFENDIKNSSLIDPSRIMARWERRSSKGLGYDLGYAISGEHFNPGIGFEMMDNFTSLRGGIKYGWLPGEKAILYSHSPELRILYMNYIADGSLMSINYDAGWSFLTKSQWMGSLHLIYNIENLKDSLEIQENEVYISPGKYKFANIMGIFSTPGTKPLYIMLTTTAGQFFDGTRVSVNMKPTWNISRHLELGAIYNFDKLWFKLRDEKFTNHIVGIKALYMLNTRLSVSSYIQYNTAVHGIISNLRLRYNPKEGNDFYLVFNEGRNTNLTREVPNLPIYNSRSVLLKYTYTFSL
jgi:Domain of unknown function (DUF5916)